MARIYPFRGYRYQKDQVGSLDAVVTQPYDKIPDDLRTDYLGRSPYNIVRVIKNEDYHEAAQFLEEWIVSGILRQDGEPSIYIYEQEFQFEGERLARIGLIGMVALDDPELAVKGHEKVLARPLADRLNLIRHTRANEGLVFTLFSDPDLSVDRLLKATSAEQVPCIEVRDDFGVVNRLWAVTDPDLVGGVQQALAGLPLYIADGHHRYQTSLTFYQECRDRGWATAAPESFDKRMVALFNMDSEGMRILPTHRGVRGIVDFHPDHFVSSLRGKFRVEQAASVDSLVDRINRGRHLFGFCWLRKGEVEAVAASLEGQALLDSTFMPTVSGPLRELDVSILHSGVFDGVLGISPEAVAGGERVSYYRERGELVQAVRDGAVQLGCFLKPTSLDQVKEVSEFGAKMPQKSTDFFPKLLTGLVLMKMSISEKGD